MGLRKAEFLQELALGSIEGAQSLVLMCNVTSGLQSLLNWRSRWSLPGLGLARASAQVKAGPERMRRGCSKAG